MRAYNNLGAFLHKKDYIFFQAMTQKDELSALEVAEVALQVGGKRPLSPDSQRATCKLNEYVEACS